MMVGAGVKTPPRRHKSWRRARRQDLRRQARIYGVDLPTKSPPRLRRAQDLSVSSDGTEQCKLGASNNGAELRVQILKSYLQGHICEIFSKKKAKNKKIRGTYAATHTIHIFICPLT